MPDGVLMQHSFINKTAKSLQGKAPWSSTSHNVTPSSGQDTPVNSGLPFLSLATHSQRGTVGSPAAPARGPGCSPGSREQQPFNQVSAYQWLIVATRQRSQRRATWNPASPCISHAWAPRGPHGHSLQPHSLGTAGVLNQPSWPVGREGRKETQSSFLCSPLWAQLVPCRSKEPGTVLQFSTSQQRKPGIFSLRGSNKSQVKFIRDSALNPALLPFHSPHQSRARPQFSVCTEGNDPSACNSWIKSVPHPLQNEKGLLGWALEGGSWVHPAPTPNPTSTLQFTQGAHRG